MSFLSHAQEVKKENQTKSKRTFWDYGQTQVLSRGKYFKEESCKSETCETTDEHGEWEYYNRLGELEEVRHYYKGMLYGSVVLYYPNGNKRQEGFFKYDRQDSVYREWHENGNLKIEGEYDMDSPTGRWSYYYRDGRLQSVEEVKGEDNYVWEFYFPDSLHTQGIKDGNGEMFVYYTTATVREWYTYKDGLKNGPFEEISIYGYPTLSGSFKDGNKDGEWKYYYYTGDLEKVSHYEDGVLNGAYEYYYDNKQLNVSGQYKNGLKVGKWTWYTNKGTRDMEGTFKDGEMHGDWIYWYPTGEISYYAHYDMGKKTGQWTYKYKNGKTFKEGTFANDEKNGTWKTWYEDGTLLMEGDYIDGKEHGEWKNYWETGDLKNVASFKEGLLEGDWQSFYTNGKPLVEGEYKNGMKVGEWRDYFENGRVKQIDTYKVIKKKTSFNDQIMSKMVVYESILDGPSQSFSGKDFKLTEQGAYKDGEKDGEWIAFHPGGRMPAVVSNYKHGKLEGTMKTFTRNGKLLQEIEYKNGLKHGKFIMYDKRGKIIQQFEYSEGMRVIEGQTGGNGTFTPGR